MIKTLKEFINLFKKDIKLKWTCEQYSNIMDNHDDDIFDLTDNLGKYDTDTNLILHFDSDNNCHKNFYLNWSPHNSKTISSSTSNTSKVDIEFFEINNFLTKRFLERV